MDIEANKRKEDFFSQLHLSEATLKNYKVALNSCFLKEMRWETALSNYRFRNIMEVVFKN